MSWARVLHFDDPFCCQQAIRAADVELYPTTRGAFSSDLTQIAFERLWMQRFHQRLPQVATFAVRPGRKAISFLTDASELQHGGADVAVDDIIVHDCDTVHQRSGANFHNATMSLKSDDFEVSTATICGHDFKQRSGRHLVRPAPELMQRLVSLHNVVGQTARITPKVFELPRVTEALEHQLIHIMVRCLTDGLPSTASSGSHRHGSIIAKFEEYLEANPNTPLYLAQICEATGTAERTLRAACEAHLGMGPIRYLALRRMHLVRRALLHASPNATVTSTVTDFGFWELGRFAVNYRALFGETPSDTLHRSHHRGAAAPKRPSSLQAAEFT